MQLLSQVEIEKGKGTFMTNPVETQMAMVLAEVGMALTLFTPTLDWLRGGICSTFAPNFLLFPSVII